MAITFLVLGVWIVVVTLLAPLDEERALPRAPEFDLTPSRGARWAGGAIILATALLYVVFR